MNVDLGEFPHGIRGSPASKAIVPYMLYEKEKTSLNSHDIYVNFIVHELYSLCHGFDVVKNGIKYKASCRRRKLANSLVCMFLLPSYKRNYLIFKIT